MQANESLWTVSVALGTFPFLKPKAWLHILTIILPSPHLAPPCYLLPVQASLKMVTRSRRVTLQVLLLFPIGHLD